MYGSLVVGANENYMNGLIGLQAALNTLRTDEANEALRNDAAKKTEYRAALFIV